MLANMTEHDLKIALLNAFLKWADLMCGDYDCIANAHIIQTLTHLSWEPRPHGAAQIIHNEIWLEIPCAIVYSAWVIAFLHW